MFLDRLLVRLTISVGSSKSSVGYFTLRSWHTGSLVLLVGIGLVVAIFGGAPTAAQEPSDATQPLDVPAKEPAPGADKRGENSKPTFSIDPANREVPENSPAGTNVGRAVTATDPDRDTLAYSLYGTGSDKFAVDANGQITVASDNSLDYETTPSYALTLGVKDEKDDNGVVAPTETDDATVVVNISLSDVSSPAVPYDLGFSAGPTDRDTSRIIRWRTRVIAGVPPATGFEAQYRPVGIDDWTIFTFESDGSTTEATITGLASNTFYEAQVRAINIEGPSPWSESTYATTSTAQLIVAFGNAAYSVIEGQTVNITVTVSPPADRNVTLTVTMTGDGAAFVDASGNELRLAVTRGVESTTFGVITDANSGGEEVDLALAPPTGRLSLGDPSTATVTINRTPIVNSAPSFTKGSNTERTVLENSPVGANVGGAVVATDADADPLTYTLSGPDAALFDLHPATGQLTVASGTSLDYEAKVSYSVTVQASDGKATAEIAVAIGVTNVGESPVLDDGVSTTIEIAENSSTGANVGQAITATDPEGSSVTYSLAGEDASLFRIHSTTGQISVAPGVSLDFETKASYAATVQASDGETTAAIAVTINVTDVPPPPSPKEPGLSAGSTNLTSQRTIKWTAPDTTGIPPVTGYDVRYRPWGTGDEWADHSFDSDGNTAETTITGLESNTEYEAQVRAVNLEGPGPWSESARATTHKAQLTVAFSSPTYTGTEGQTVDIEVTVNPAADREVTVTITMAGEGATFGDAIGDGLELTISRGESSGEITIEGEEDDDLNDAEVTLTLSTNAAKVSFGEPSITTVTISDNTPNTLPSFVDGSNTQRSVPENSVAGTNVGVPLTAIDSDGHTLIYTLSGAAAALFEIGSATGQLTVASGTNLNHEAGVSYSVTVQASDGTATAEIAVAIDVTDVNEAPRFGDGVPTTIEVTENSPAGTSIGQAFAVIDPEGDTLTYSLSGTGTDKFSVDGGGQITVAGTLDFETTSSYALTLGVKDEKGDDGAVAPSELDDATIEVSIGVTNVNEPPTFDDGAPTTIEIAENSSIGTNVGPTFTANDPEGDTLAYSLSGTESDKFSVGGRGQITVADDSLDYESTQSYVIVLGIKDNKDDNGVATPNEADDTTFPITIKVINVNEPPVFHDGFPTTVEIAENSPVGTNVSQAFTAIDPEGDALSYSLSGTGSDQFAVYDRGQITIAGSLDYETTVSYVLTLGVKDKRDDNGDADPIEANDATIALTISITDLLPPLAPYDLGFSAASGSTDLTSERTIKWTAPDTTGIPQVTSYEVRYRSSRTDGEWTDHYFDSDGRTTQTTIAGLASNTQYEAQVRAVNIEGPSPWSESVYATTHKVRLTVAFGYEAYEVTEGRIVNVAVTVDPSADRRVDVTVTMTGEGATLADATDRELKLLIPRGDASAIFGVSANAHSGGREITLALTTTAVIVSVGEPPTTTVTINHDRTTNDSPSFTEGSNTERTVPENSPAGTHIGPTVKATDTDGDPLTYSIFGSDAALFDIHFFTGQITVAGGAILDYEAVVSHSVTVRVSDRDRRAVAEIAVTITVTNVNEAPTFDDAVPTQVEIAENSPAGTPVGKAFTASDPEGDSFTYAISGPDETLFAIDSSSGQIEVASGTRLDYEDSPKSYSVTVQASDGEAAADLAITINVTNVNEAPTFDDDISTNIEVAENSPSGTNVGQAFTATDPEGDTLIYSLSASDAAFFRINPATGQMTVARGASLDYEAGVTYSVTVHVSDGYAASDITVTIGVTDVNEAPVFDDGATTIIEIAENSSTGTNVGQPLTATDPEGDTFTYSLTSSDAAFFDIHPTTGQIIVASEARLDYESGVRYSLMVQASDGEEASEIAVSVRVTDVNEPPVFGNDIPTTIEIAENSEVGTFVGAALTATDPEGDELTYSLSGDDVAFFKIEAATGQISVDLGVGWLGVGWFNVGLDYETKSSYPVIVRASDGNGVAELALTIRITDLPPPTAPYDLGFSAAAGTTDLTSERTIKWTAPDTTGIPPVTRYEVRYRPSGTDGEWADHDFHSDGAVTETTITGLSSNTEYEAQVGAINIEGPSPWSESVYATTHKAQLTVAFGNSTYDVTEGQTGNVAVTVSPAADRDVLVTIIMTGDGAQFADAVGDELMVTVSRGDSSVELTIQGDEDDDVNDAEVMLALSTNALKVSLGEPSTTTVTIDDNTLNSPPSFADGQVTERAVPENSALGANVGGAVIATDSNGQTLSYTLVGDDGPLFEVGSATGQITVGSGVSLDYEAKASYSVTVQASDGTANAEIAVMIQVIDVNEPPTFDDGVLTAIEIAENSPSSTKVGQVFAAADPEGDTLTYSLSGTGSGKFLVDATGQIISADSLDYETKPSYDLTLGVKDNRDDDGAPVPTEGDDATISLTINVADVNEPPAFDDGITTAVEIAENLPASTNVGQAFPATDPEGDTLTYSLSGTGSDKFLVDAIGQITLVDSLDYETMPSYALILGAKDNRDNHGAPSPTEDDDATVSLTISVTDLNEPPAFDDGITTVVKIAENSLASTKVGQAFTATDPDSDILTYSLSGTGSDKFLVDVTGQITSADSLDHETKPSYDLVLGVRDNRDDEGAPAPTEADDATVSVTISVTNVNEPPAFDDGITTVVEVAENSPASTRVGRAFAAADPEGDTLTYSLSGTGSDKFLVAATGQITLADSLDYETTPSYALILGVKDSRHDDGAPAPTEGDDATVSVTINVSDVNEPPVFDDGITTVVEVAENSPASTRVGRAFAADDPEGDTLTYSLSGTGSDEFFVNSTGQIRTVDSLDYETVPSYELILGVKDSRDDDGLDAPTEDDDATVSVTINVADVNEPPFFDGGIRTAIEIAENSAAGKNVGQAFAATDPEGNTLTYSLSGEGSNTFAVNANGQMTVGADAVLDFEAIVNIYAVMVQVTDGLDAAGAVDVAIDDAMVVAVNVTDVAEPPGKVLFVTVTSGESGALLVSWEEAANSGPPVRYEVEYRAENDQAWTAQLLSGPRARTTIGGLVSGTRYQARVRAVNDEGEGEWSVPATVATAALPAAPTGLKAPPAACSLRLAWNNPNDASITGYQYRLRSEDDQDWGPWADMDPSRASTVNWTIDELTDGIEYSVQIRAKNAQGHGAASNVVSAIPTTEPEAGVGPTAKGIVAQGGLRASLAGNGRIALVWNNPNDPSITSYQYRWRAVDDEAWTWWRDIPVNAVLSHILPVLTPVTTYKVQVRALRSGVADGPMEVTATATSVTATGCDVNSGLASDCEVLLLARDELAGGGTLNWSADVPISEWDGVTVVGIPKRVTGLRLEGYGLTGTTPSRLGSLAGLTGLWLDDNQLTGSIPAELGLLANLEWLYLSSNRLTGSIPAELGGLSNLRGLHLSSNQLTGTIPSELGGLAGLEWMDLSSNEFGGGIPVEFGGLAKLGVLSLSYNQLGGSIPAELGGLANLKWLYLSSNRLTGSIPSELGSLANLRVLRLNDNQLSGSIPAELGRLINLTVLGLSNNRLTGTVPAELAGLTNLTELFLDGNRLSETTPDGVGMPQEPRTSVTLGGAGRAPGPAPGPAQ